MHTKTFLEHSISIPVNMREGFFHAITMPAVQGTMLPLAEIQPLSFDDQVLDFG